LASTGKAREGDCLKIADKKVACVLSAMPKCVWEETRKTAYIDRRGARNKKNSLKKRGE